MNSAYFYLLLLSVGLASADERDDLARDLNGKCEGYKTGPYAVSSEKNKICDTTTNYFLEATLKSEKYDECDARESLWKTLLNDIPPKVPAGKTMVLYSGYGMGAIAYSYGEPSASTYRPLELSFPGYLSGNKVFCTKDGDIKTIGCPPKSEQCLMPVTRSFWLAASSKFADRHSGAVAIFLTAKGVDNSYAYSSTSVLATKEVPKLKKGQEVNIYIQDTYGITPCTSDATVTNLKNEIRSRTGTVPECYNYLPPKPARDQFSAPASYTPYDYENVGVNAGIVHQSSVALWMTGFLHLLLQYLSK